MACEAMAHSKQVPLHIHDGRIFMTSVTCIMLDLERFYHGHGDFGSFMKY